MAKDKEVVEEVPAVEVGSEFAAAVEGGDVVLKPVSELSEAQARNLTTSDVADDSLEDTVVLGFAEVAARVKKNK